MSGRGDRHDPGSSPGSGPGSGRTGPGTDLDADLFDPELLKQQLAGESIEPAVEIPITDVLDLHPFRPQEIADVVREYLDAAAERGLAELRIIHGRGIGVQRKTVRTILERDPRVLRFSDAPGGAGGWGATLVWLSVV